MAKKKQTIVIKIGSALLVDATGKFRDRWLTGLVADIAGMVEQGDRIVIVSSGAVALGRHCLATNRRNLKLEEKQAAAACGQALLINAYQKRFNKYNIPVAQILLTIEDTEDRRRYLNAYGTINTLLKSGIIPVINENDTVATGELRFGDNDRLAARVAQMTAADRLILLSDIDGLYTANPHNDESAEHIAEVAEIDDNIRGMADGKGSHGSSGGMTTKISAAEIATSSGCETVIANGMVMNPLKKLEEGAAHTLFLPRQTADSARKNWIAHNLRPKGEVIIDDGAKAALLKGKSLLPAGVVRVSGKFNRGDAVVIKGSNDIIGYGLAAFDANDAEKIIGHKSSEMEKILNYSGRYEMIHRDNMVLE